MHERNVPPFDPDPPDAVDASGHAHPEPADDDEREPRRVSLGRPSGPPPGERADTGHPH